MADNEVDEASELGSAAEENALHPDSPHYDLVEINRPHTMRDDPQHKHDSAIADCPNRIVQARRAADIDDRINPTTAPFAYLRGPALAAVIDGEIGAQLAQTGALFGR